MMTQARPESNLVPRILGTRFDRKLISYPESSGFLVSGWATNRWPKSLRTLGTGLTESKRGRLMKMNVNTHTHGQEAFLFLYKKTKLVIKKTLGREFCKRASV